MLHGVTHRRPILQLGLLDVALVSVHDLLSSQQFARIAKVLLGLQCVTFKNRSGHMKLIKT